MKKKILFFIPTLGGGGAEKVLVNLVNNLDSSKFEITVQTVFDGGIYKNSLNDNVTYKYSFKKEFRGFSHFLKLFSPKQLHSLLINEFYDIEVAFLEAVSTRIISGCNNPNTKLISWVHCTMHDQKEATIGYRNWTESVSAYDSFHKIVCVSKSVEKAFNDLYDQESKTTTVYNINESEKIRKLCLEDDVDVKNMSFDSFNISAVGKVIEVKGFDRLARVQKRLIEDGYNTHVYILGVGEKQSEIEKYLIEERIQDSWSFLGFKKNPYVWIKNSDLFVCSSRSEGLSTAVTEALLVGTPVITTNVSGMSELLENGKSGMIVDNDEISLYKGIKKLLDDSSLLFKYKKESERRGEDFIKQKIIMNVENELLF